MSHLIYETRGIVLGSINRKEADRYLYIFTRDLGMISAIAQGLRNSKSKLRYGLQEFSYSDIVLVRGKDVWRVTNSSPKTNLFYVFREEKSKFIIVNNLFNLLRILLKGEEKNEKLFLIVEKAILFLREMLYDDDLLKSFECIIVMRVLNNLGYFNSNGLFDDFISDYDWSESLLFNMTSLRDRAIDVINRSLKETHL